ncbi:hypothetical protein OHB26_39375 (plasmid) [Nocardia sp. NBC_01503]|uniref:hypothetical protein n=1 Tax=Nocardia sp. NBC_01503 TaxID=2975997 RepID=UPI002E7B1E21|nr:hypothetical protein [Nocardia sp. NBC_01503]WTL36706.1 hypothetical protein OHB26_39200 [Nocardia sp. NBC_01503]WTL36741.1 hypothetical protein OHB26_39375 [Nocardia sp. NBC_01503]
MAEGLDFEADDFEAEEFYPFATTQQWAVLNTDIDESALAVLTFTMCHLNPHTGKFDAKFGRKRVAERFNRSLDWVDKQYNKLIAAGALSKRHMFWSDGAKTGRTPDQIDPETGKRRSPAPNRWRVRMNPPGGAAYPGATKIAEYYKSDLVSKRLAGQGVAATQRPVSDQAKPEGSPAGGVAAAQRLGVAATQRPGLAAAQRPERTRKGKTTGENKSVRSVRSEQPTARDAKTDPDGRTEESPIPEAQEQARLEAAPGSVAAALVAHAALQPHFARIDLKPSQHRQLIEAVDQALLRFSPGQVATYLADKAREAKTATYLVQAFTEYSDAISQVRPRFQRSDYRDEQAFMAAVSEAQQAIAWLDAGAPIAEPTRPTTSTLPAEAAILPTQRSEIADHGLVTKMAFCTLCGGSGWVNGPSGDPVEPALRCGCPTAPEEIAHVLTRVATMAAAEPADNPQPSSAEVRRAALEAAKPRSDRSKITRKSPVRRTFTPPQSAAV